MNVRSRLLSYNKKQITNINMKTLKSRFEEWLSVGRTSWFDESMDAVDQLLTACVCFFITFCHQRYGKQLLSYRKQIACQLRTQYGEGIYDNPVTLKSRLTVTQGHWKRKYWVDHTRLTISRVIGRWILSWPWNVAKRSLKVIEINAIRKLGCGFPFAFYSNCGRICSRLRDIVNEWRDLENQVRGR